MIPFPMIAFGLITPPVTDGKIKYAVMCGNLAWALTTKGELFVGGPAKKFTGLGLMPDGVTHKASSGAWTKVMDGVASFYTSTAALKMAVMEDGRFLFMAYDNVNIPTIADNNNKNIFAELPSTYFNGSGLTTQNIRKIVNYLPNGGIMFLLSDNTLWQTVPAKLTKVTDNVKDYDCSVNNQIYCDTAGKIFAKGYNGNSKAINPAVANDANYTTWQAITGATLTYDAVKCSSHFDNVDVLGKYDTFFLAKEASTQKWYSKGKNVGQIDGNTTTTAWSEISAPVGSDIYLLNVKSYYRSGFEPRVQYYYNSKGLGVSKASGGQGETAGGTYVCPVLCIGNTLGDITQATDMSVRIKASDSDPTALNGTLENIFWGEQSVMAIIGGECYFAGYNANVTEFPPFFRPTSGRKWVEATNIDDGTLGV